MPNHVTNRLTILGTKEEINEVLEFIKLENSPENKISGIGTIDFNKITPMPKWVFQGDLSSKEEKKYGSENCWYEWCVTNWGTKWNAYSQLDDRNTENTIYFQTAWGGVPELIEKLAWIFPNVTIKYAYANEDFGHGVASYTFKDTDITSFVPDGGSKDAYELAMEIWDYEPKDINLVYKKEIDNYVYVYEDEDEE